MANTKSAAKRARQTERRTLRNKSILTSIRTQQKKLTVAVAAGDQAQAEATLRLLMSRLDKAAKSGVVHRNLAARRKSRATKAVSQLAAKATPASAAAVAQPPPDEAAAS
ncbi:MAG: 30S ribosomal protein S20 [Verrucomicrobia bacterium]|nr:30S ribosomal protein S20 [Verrucomicrobiota bacterium]